MRTSIGYTLEPSVVSWSCDFACLCSILFQTEDVLGGSNLVNLWHRLRKKSSFLFFFFFFFPFQTDPGNSGESEKPLGERSMPDGEKTKGNGEEAKGRGHICSGHCREQERCKHIYVV